MKRFFYIACLFLLLPSMSWAACSGPASVDIPYPAFSVNNGDPIPMHNPMINDTLDWTPEFQADQDIAYSTCPIRPTSSVVRGVGSIIPGVSYSDQYGTYAVYDIPGVDGIGYVLRARAKVTDWVAIGNQETTIRTISPTDGDSTRLFFSIRLYAYGAPPPGNYTIPKTTLAQWGVRDENGALLQDIGWIPINTEVTSLVINTVSCSVTSPSEQTAVLPVVGNSEFFGAGSTTSASASFQFSLNCPPEVALHAVMTDGVNPGNTSDTLTLTSDSTASGVGVQIFREGQATPIAFGPDSPVAGTVNQWFVGTGSNSYVLPFEARYVQTTGNRVTPGTVNSLATITFSYQ
ncbi:fimbrial protein [Halomonas binhaiensis]|uniref:Fimbrial protein n=1 Tax=Halomonas binhaiensis TaxID=2562282 RepID=A0A5C1NBL1_9GAMM|nr:fimbrial protein [Halomonas binhaiensis]QEM80330.1 fimbrial protein [Halomonas binhaiensis]